MTDEFILALFWRRSEEAIHATAERYGGFLTRIALHILHQREDAEECVNDTYWTAWRQIPPDRPMALRSYLGRITRCHALNRFDYLTAQKRGSEFVLQLDELAECLPGGQSPESQCEAGQLGEVISVFLRTQEEEARLLFIRRYWYCDSIRELAQRYGLSQSKVKSALLRTRSRLRDYLQKEGYVL